MDEFDSNTTPMDESHDEQHVEGSSRRTFLKAAVVGSATAVAVSGVGAAAFTLTGHHTGLKKYLALTDTISGITEKACTTKSDDTQSDPPDTYGNDTIFFWCKFNNVPASGAGFYTIDVSPEPGSATAIVDYPPGNGNYVQIVFYSGGDSSFDCNPSTLPSTGFVAQQASLPVTFQTASDGDVLLWLHIKGTASGSETLTATLYQGTTPTGSGVGSASATFTLT